MEDTHCANCGKLLEERTPEDEKEMLEELNKDFPSFSVEECSVVCEDCHRKIQAWMDNFN